jgi:hypothetical protein
MLDAFFVFVSDAVPFWMRFFDVVYILALLVFDIGVFVATWVVSIFNFLALSTMRIFWLTIMGIYSAIMFSLPYVCEAGVALLVLSRAGLESLGRLCASACKALMDGIVGMNKGQLAFVVILSILVNLVWWKRNCDLLEEIHRLRNRRRNEINSAASDNVGNAADIANAKPNIGVCTICMDKEINAVFFPCGHLLSCIDCGRNLRSCPYCSEKTNFVCQRAYFVGV